MRYEAITEGEFIKRENRFIAEVLIEGKKEICHVKNTGRCKELLKEGVKIFLEKSDKKERKTKYSLISVIKGERLINMDSQAPNKAVKEWLEEGGLIKNIKQLKAEKSYKKSRFDFYAEYDEKKCFIEVKGVTLEEGNIVSFPDAPTKRGCKHLYELCEAIEEGYEGYIIFVVQMDKVKWFEPNYKNDPEFASALVYAKSKGVKIIAVECETGKDYMKITKEVLVKIEDK